MFSFKIQLIKTFNKQTCNGQTSDVSRFDIADVMIRMIVFVSMMTTILNSNIMLDSIAAQKQKNNAHTRIQKNQETPMFFFALEKH